MKKMSLAALIACLVFSACNPAGSKLDAAKKAFEEKGASADVMALFVDIAKTYPNTPEAGLATGYALCVRATVEPSVEAWQEYLGEDSSLACKDRAEAWLAENDRQDKAACEEAKTAMTAEKWGKYVERFPKGKCADAAQDSLACLKARKEGTYSVWKTYSKTHENGVCLAEAQALIGPYEKEARAVAIKNIKTTLTELAKECESMKKDIRSDWNQSIDFKTFWETPERFVDNKILADMMTKDRVQRIQAFFILSQKAKKDLPDAPKCTEALGEAARRAMNACSSSKKSDTEWITTAGKVECE